MINKNGIKTFLTDRTWLGRWCYQYYKRWKGREKRKSYGNENPDKTFYVIGYDDESGGLFWLVNKVVMHIAYALDHNYIPVVDFMNHRTQYTNPQELHKENVWEKFFEQPAGYRMEDIRNSRNIIINRQEPAPQQKYLMGQETFYDNPVHIKFFHDIFQKYIKCNAQTKKHIESMRQRFFPEGKRIVGVLCRGTDYVVIRPKGHPIQPATADVISDVRNVMREQKCDYVFLSTEDEDIVEAFKSAFSEKLIYIPQKRIKGSEMTGKHYLAQEKERKLADRDRHEDALIYLSSIYMLTCCNCFIGGRTGGTKGVLLMSNGFEYCKIYDIGLYS